MRERVARAVRQGAHCGPGELLVAVATAVAIVTGWVLVLPLGYYLWAQGDTTTYLDMAADPKGTHWPPLAFRVLEPWLAHAIGGPDHYLTAFEYLTWGSLAAAGVALYLICRRLGGAHGAGLVAVVGFLSLPTLLFFVYIPYLVDGMAMALLAWSMLALINGWYAVLPLLFMVTGLARETVIGFAVPVYLWLRARWVDLGAAWRTALFLAPAFVVTWAIRQPSTYTEEPNTLGLMKYGLLQYVGQEVVPNPGFFLTYGIAGSLGMWWVLGFYGRSHGGRLWWLLVPVFAQWLFGSDYGRYALYAFPVVVACGAIAVWRHPRRVVLLVLVGLQSVAVLADLWFTDEKALHLYRLQPSTWIAVGLGVLAAAVLWWPVRRRPAAEVPRPREESAVPALEGTA